MTMISPVSDLRNYNVVLEKIKPGSPVFLTVNGRGRYTIRDIADDEEFERTKAMLQLMIELHEGRQSGEEKGYSDSSDVRERLKHRLRRSAHEIQLFTGYYFVVYKAYIAFYFPTDDGIRIERTLHAKSDYIRWIIPRTATSPVPQSVE